MGRNQDKEKIPLKQGLKLHGVKRSWKMARDKEKIPLKQGLKPIELRVFVQF